MCIRDRWIERLVPVQKAAGSIPAGDTAEYSQKIAVQKVVDSPRHSRGARSDDRAIPAGDTVIFPLNGKARNTKEPGRTGLFVISSEKILSKCRLPDSGRIAREIPGAINRAHSIAIARIGGKSGIGIGCPSRGSHFDKIRASGILAPFNAIPCNAGGNVTRDNRVGACHP